MAYKFQLGAARLSGSLVQEGAMTAESAAVSGSSMTLPKDGLTINGVAVSTTAAELNVLDAATAGTVVASKAVVVDSNKDADGFRNMSGSGLIEFSQIDVDRINVDTQFIIGAKTISETEFGYLDGLTIGTVAASKAVVVDANKDASGFRNVSGSGNFDLAGNIDCFGNISVNGDVLPVAADGSALGSANKEFSDLYLADSAEIKLGNDQDVRLIHEADSGIILNSVNAGATNPAKFSLRLSSSSPADNDIIGALAFDGYSDAQNIGSFASISGIAKDVTDNSKDGAIEFELSVNNSMTSMMDINKTAASTITMQEIVDLVDHDGSSKGLKLGGTLVSSTAAELNKLDGAGASVTAAKLTTLTALTDAEIGYLDGAAVGNSTASKVLVLDANADFEMQDNDKIFFGDGADVSIHWDGSTMKIGTDTSGAPITIGNGTSEVTVADNLTIAGNLTVQGDTTTVDSTTIAVSSSFTFEGAANAHETTLHAGGDGTGDDPVADTSIYLPALAAGNYFLPVLADKATAASAAVTAGEFALLDGASSVGTTALASGDGFLHNDAGTMKQTSIDKIADFFAGSGLAAASGVMAVDIGELDALDSAGLHQTQDFFMFLDDDTLKKISFTHIEDSIFGNVSGDAAIAAGGALTIQANAVEGSMLNNNIVSGLTDIGADIADTDEMIISDAGTIKRTDMSRLKTYLATVATSVASGSNTATLAEGVNYFGDHGEAITANMPDNHSTVGASVRVKVGSDCSATNKLTINAYGGQTIDGESEIVLESPFAAIEMVYVVSGSWRVF